MYCLVAGQAFTTYTNGQTRNRQVPPRVLSADRAAALASSLGLSSLSTSTTTSVVYRFLPSASVHEKIAGDVRGLV
jgi:hypothetical protein